MNKQLEIPSLDISVFDPVLIPAKNESLLADRWAALAKQEKHKPGLPNHEGMADAKRLLSSPADRAALLDRLKDGPVPRYHTVSDLCAESGRSRTRYNLAIRELIRLGLIVQEHGRVPNAGGRGWRAEAFVLRLAEDANV